MLPAPLAARALAKAIEKHAWTFCGSGTFRTVSPYCFEIENNPIVRGEISSHPLCHWHAAVFERLYRSLVDPGITCTETRCAAMGGGICRFELIRA
jgi:divinyl protochlorophyllide a 8-vinyl-reductase